LKKIPCSSSFDFELLPNFEQGEALRNRSELLSGSESGSKKHHRKIESDINTDSEAPTQSNKRHHVDAIIFFIAVLPVRILSMAEKKKPEACAPGHIVVAVKV